MPIYNITETKPATLRWEFTVEAASEEEALHMVQNGDIFPDECFTDENPFDDSEYEVEEAQ